MALTEKQYASLAGDLDSKHVKTRRQAGFTLSYVEGWHVIAEANRIFGFDNWSSETVDLKCIVEYPCKIGPAPQRQGDRPQRDGHAVTYTAKVRIEVAGVTREGSGTGHGRHEDLGLAHESALKEAETDARKRALMTFGNKFGLALYDKTQANVSAGADEADEAAEAAEQQVQVASEAAKQQVQVAAEAGVKYAKSTRQQANDVIEKARETAKALAKQAADEADDLPGRRINTEPAPPAPKPRSGGPIERASKAIVNPHMPEANEPYSEETGEVDEIPDGDKVPFAGKVSKDSSAVCRNTLLEMLTDMAATKQEWEAWEIKRDTLFAQMLEPDVFVVREAETDWKEAVLEAKRKRDAEAAEAKRYANRQRTGSKVRQAANASA